eukprot:5386373-Amphidinium_carterae.1
MAILLPAGLVFFELAVAVRRALCLALSVLITSSVCTAIREGTGGLTPPEKASRHALLSKCSLKYCQFLKAEVAEIRQILSMDIMPSLLAAAADAQQYIDRLYQDVLDCQVEVADRQHADWLEPQVTTGLEVNREMWLSTQTKQKIIEECVEEEVDSMCGVQTDIAFLLVSPQR